MNELIRNLDFAAYRALDGLSISTLKVLRDSPMKYRHNLMTPREETPAMVLGTAAHCAILEPAKIKAEYVLWNGGTRRGKDWDAFKGANTDKHILTVDEFEAINGMRKSVRQFAPATRYLTEGEAEVSMLWTDPETGRACRGRIDWLTKIDGRWIIVDLKTTRTASAFGFGSQAAKLGYYLQLAYYFDGFYEITGQYPDMKILAVESSAPYEPALFSIPDEIIEQGRDEYRALLVKLSECEQANSWPPALEMEEPLTLPSWVYGAMDDDLSGLGLIA